MSESSPTPARMSIEEVINCNNQKIAAIGKLLIDKGCISKDDLDKAFTQIASDVTKIKNPNGKHQIMAELIAPAVLGSVFVWTMTALAKGFSGGKEQWFVFLFAATIALFTVIAFLVQKVEGAYSWRDFFSDLLDLFCIFGIFYWLGLVEGEPHCFGYEIPGSLPCAPWAYGCVTVIAFVSMFGYRKEVVLPNIKHRWPAIVGFFILSLLGNGFMALSPERGIHWFVSVVMLLGMFCYMVLVVKDHYVMNPQSSEKAAQG